ncbi:MAG: hypothetical protein C4539_18985 [Ignavibacteriales bacterium]|nr:MAG: hypothetical protein C4539_18985 [Ignavibacteriales bacterium]
MVNSISGSGSIQYQPFNDSATKLTDEQKETLQSIISNYDPENMTQESMKAMMEEIKAAGITPGKELRDIMDAAGFKPPEKPQGPPPQESADIQNSLPQFLIDFMEKQQSGEVTQEDIDSLIANLQASGKTTVGSLVDQKS